MTLAEIQALSDDQLDRAIAERLGWDERENYWRSPVGENHWGPPAYSWSLDACHEVEKMLQGDTITAYWQTLIHCLPGKVYEVWEAIHAPARHRAEALLLTLTAQ